MIPNTLGAALGFLALVAPGVVFELLREKRRQALTDTAFREASRIALTSLVFSVGAFLVLVALDGWWHVLPDVDLWVRTGNAYLREQYRVVATACLAQLVTACVLAALANRVLTLSGRGRAEIRHGSVWYHVLREDRPPNAVVWLQARLTDGTIVTGYLRHYTPGDKLEDREICLGGRFLHLAKPGAEPADISADWAAVTVRGSEIVTLQVVYMDAVTGDRVPRWTRPSLRARIGALLARVPGTQGEPAAPADGGGAAQSGTDAVSRSSRPAK